MPECGVACCYGARFWTILRLRYVDPSEAALLAASAWILRRVAGEVLQ